jgi:hypothetical protein
MTTLETARDNNREGPDLPAKIEVTVRTGRDEERVVDIEIGQPAVSILIVIADQWGCAVEELMLFRDGENDPIPGGTIIGPDYPHRHRHHVHHSRNVEVIVHYQVASHHREFKRFQTIETVLDWAIPAFGIDPTMAPEFELARPETKEELPLNEHLGHLAGRHDRLELNLVRGDIANG